MLEYIKVKEGISDVMTNNFFMKLWVKFVLVFSLLVILGGGSIEVYLSTIFLAQFRTIQETHLVSIAEMSKAIYVANVENNRVRTADWSSDGYIRNKTEELLDSAIPAKRKQEISSELGTYLRLNKMKYDPSIAITDIIDKNGVVIASSREGRVGMNEGEEEQYLRTTIIKSALGGEMGRVYVSSMVTERNEDVRPMTHITSRIFSTKLDDNEKPIPLDGVILVHFVSGREPLNFLEDAASEDEGHGDIEVLSAHYETWELYLARATDGMILTSPRKGKDHVVLASKVDRNITSTCADEKKDFHGEYANYEGVSVMGVMECIEDGHTMLMVEAATDEILAPFYDMQKKIILAIFAMLFFVVLLSIFVSRSILRPLNDIVLVADRVAKKDFTARVKVRSKNEIGQLGRVFNEMLDSIARYEADISASAKELSEKVLAMEKQNDFLKDVRRAMLNLLQDSWKLGATLKKEQERSMSIITSMSEGLIVVDMEKKITLMNPTAERLLEIKQSDALEKNVEMIWKMFQGDKELIEDERFVERTLQTRQSVSVGIEENIFVQTTSRRKFPVVVATTLLTTKDAEGVLVVFRDVTEEKALNDAKSNFISIASHQLRTPLTSIRWYSEVLSDGSMGPLSEMQADFLKEIYQGSIRLFRTIDTLLALSRVESGKFQEHPVVLDAKVFAEGVVKEVEPLLREKKITTHIDAEDALPNIFVDAFMLKEVLTNLLANSIRYTNDEGVIDVFIKKEDDHVLCAVHDNGIGIPDSQKEKIFSRFFRAENALNKVPDGSGLGLSLVKELVEKWGGKVWFESKEGEGTTFFITIPIAKDAVSA